MAKKRIRIDLEDSDGAKYNFNIEGNITRDKVIKIFELMNLMNIEDQETAPQLDSVGAKVWHIVDKYFPMGNFTSNEILEKYEDEYNEPVKLSVISTYLARFNTKGRIDRLRQGKAWVYQIAKIPQKTD
ncbi:hypothetical protein [Candidatus Nitrosotenuis cloacae]|jgi:hypothetical protein|uniref:Uncharacterized protein n=1 Tax=Candidatus Nitrosotenuis cloacae TaxID=1603555 RepID=A0A3G1B5F9_9ARCH|nr:hypothetical protein [Candidatus Nitrosotenuis cloacae]AJZ76034.1 hypothetical protein SU86_006235 [Candidatus Nitrosotenuis cloacae]